MNTTEKGPLGQLAKRIHAALDKTEHSRKEWIEGTLELATALFEARKCFENNKEFSEWLDKNKLDGLGKDDRAALISMGENLDVTRTALEKTGRMSWRLIWQKEIKPRVLSAENPREHNENKKTEKPKKNNT